MIWFVITIPADDWIATYNYTDIYHVKIYYIHILKLLMAKILHASWQEDSTKSSKLLMYVAHAYPERSTTTLESWTCTL